MKTSLNEKFSEILKDVKIYDGTYPNPNVTLPTSLVDFLKIMNREHLENSLRAFTWNIIHIDSKNVYSNCKNLKLIKDLLNVVATSKLDKENGVGLPVIKVFAFFHKKKLSELIKIGSLSVTHISTIQNYLRSSFERSELTKEKYKKLRLQDERISLASALPEIHKNFNVLPKFRAIVDTTFTCDYNVGSYLTELLNPPTQNEFMILLMLPTK